MTVLHALISLGNEKVKGVWRAATARVKNSAAISIGAAKEKGATSFCGAAAEHKRSDRDGERQEKLREEHCTRAHCLLRASIPFRARRLPLIMLPRNSLRSSPRKGLSLARNDDQTALHDCAWGQFCHSMSRQANLSRCILDFVPRNCNLGSQ